MPKLREAISVILAASISCASCARDGRVEGSGSPSATTAARAPEAPRGFRLDGVPFVPAAVLATGTEGESSWRITVSRTPLSCAELRASYPDHPKGDRALDVWLTPPLGTDGVPEPWSYRSGHELTEGGARSLVARGAMLEGLVETPTTVVARALELSLQTRGTNPRLYQHEGELVATRCERVPRSEVAKPQPKFALTIAGTPVVVRGATLRDEGGKTYLRLTRAAHRCDSVFTEGYDFYLDLLLVGSPAKLGLVALLGGAFPESAAGSKGKDAFALDAPKLEGEGRDVPMRLDGTIDAGGYVVAMKGELTATRCVAAPK